MREYLESLLLIIKGALFRFFLKFTYHTINDSRFTMDMYCRLVVDMDINVLKKINIYIPKYVLLKINNIILNEYVQISGDEEIMEKIRDREKINKLYKKHELLRYCGIVLSSPLAKDEDKKKVIDFLKNSRYKDDFLKKIESDMKIYKIQINELKAKLENSSKENTKVQRSDFYRIFAFLEKNGYTANFDMCVLEYIQKMKLYRKEIKDMENHLNKLNK